MNSALHREETSCVFQKFEGGKVTERSIEKMIEGLIRRCEGKVNEEITPHSFRRSFATFLHRAGYSLMIIREKMGHKSIKTTQDYIKLSQQELEKVMNPLDYAEENKERRKSNRRKNTTNNISRLTGINAWKQMYNEL